MYVCLWLVIHMVPQTANSFILFMLLITTEEIQHEMNLVIKELIKFGIIADHW